MISEQKDNFLYTYDKPIIWNLSCFGNLQHMATFNNLIQILKENNVEMPKWTLHGSFTCKYNGGRISHFHDTFENIKSYIKYYNEQGIGVKMTFSNMDIHKEQFEEKEMRQYLDLLNETKGISNGIICVNDDFAELVKKNYPDLELVASYVKMELETKIGITDTPDYYNSKFDLYDVVVMNAFRAFDDDFLSKITHPEKAEFIVNHFCATNCPYGAEHHKNIELMQKVQLKNNFDDNAVSNDPEYIEWIKHNKCIQKKCSVTVNTLEKIKTQYINRDEINHLVNTFGINKFKIEGRDYIDNHFLLDLYSYIINIQGPYRFLEYKLIKNMCLPKDLEDCDRRINQYNSKYNSNKLFSNKVKLY